jgi:hypothetical protein
MKRALIWAAVTSLCLACGSTTDGDDTQVGPQGGSAGSLATTGGRGGGTAGTPARGGEAGEPPSVAGGAAGEPGAAGSGSGGDSGGAAGAGGGEACNDLELVPMQPVCYAMAPPPPTGGTIVEGVYALVAFDVETCLGLEQTLRLTQTALDTFDAETVVNIAGSRANSVLVADGTTLTSTPTCGNEDPPEVYGYAAYAANDIPHLRLMEGANVFVYQRVGD